MVRLAGQGERDGAAPRALAVLLASIGHTTEGAEWTPFQGGRSNRAWRVEAPVGPVVVKLFGAATGNPLFPNDPVAERLCLEALSGSAIAPEFIAAGASPSGNWLIYRHVPGAEWSADPAPVAQRLAGLHSRKPLSGLRQLPGGTDALTDQVERILALCHDTAEKTRLVAAKPRREDVPPSETRAFLHGDPVPGNLIVTPDGPVLIDWQCPAIGDPAEDLAVFLSPAMQLHYRGEVLSPGGEAAFLAASDPSSAARYLRLAPWYHWRMAAYCLWRGATTCPGERHAMEAELAALERY